MDAYTAYCIEINHHRLMC